MQTTTMRSKAAMNPNASYELDAAMVSNKMLKKGKKNTLCYKRGLKCVQPPWLVVIVSSPVLDLLKVPW
jgi:hypothetical protein